MSRNSNVPLINLYSLELLVSQHRIKNCLSVIMPIAISSIAPLFRFLEWLLRTASHHSSSTGRSTSSVCMVWRNHQIARLRQRLHQEGGLRIASAKPVRENNQWE